MLYRVRMTASSIFSSEERRRFVTRKFRSARFVEERERKVRAIPSAGVRVVHPNVRGQPLVVVDAESARSELAHVARNHRNPLRLLRHKISEDLLLGTQIGGLRRRERVIRERRRLREK